MIAVDLTGKAALVTGGARGIGAAVVRRLACAGAHVLLTDLPGEEHRKIARQLVEEVRSSGGMADEAPARAESTDELVSAAEAAVARFGRLDILVTCAGTTSRFPVDALEPDEWKRIIDINLNGTFRAVKAVLPHLRRCGGGAVVMIGSAAIVAGSGGGVHYAASKAALEGLCRGLTRELAPDGIRTNLVHPSLIDTDLLRQRHPEAIMRKRLADEVPLRRLGTPDDIAHMVAFLASDLAGYVTGQSIFVDGGRTFCK